MQKFTWTPFFEELLNKVCSDYTSETLVALLHKIFHDTEAITDRYKDGSSGPLKEIDPLTFIGFFNRRSRDERRIKYCLSIKNELKLQSEVPKEFSGIPVINPQSSWFFPYAKERESDSIPTLWAFAKALNEEKLDSEIFSKALNIKQIGFAKLTQICFICKPNLYMPMDANSREFLSEHGLKDQIENVRTSEDFESYKSLLAEIRKAFPTQSMAEISASAWESSNKEDSSKTQSKTWLLWAGAGGEAMGDWLARGEIAVGWDEVGDIGGKTREEISGLLDTKRPSERKHTHNSLCLYEFSSVMKPGDMVIAVTELRTVSGVARVESDYFHDASRDNLKNRRKVVWISREEKSLTAETFQEKFGMSHFVKKTLTETDRLALIEWALGESMAKTNQVAKLPELRDGRLNEIYYGPPGVGKTFKLNQLMARYSGVSSNQTEAAKYAAWTSEQSWWSVVAAVLLSTGKPMQVDEISGHPLMQAKIRQSSTKTPRNSIWAALQTHTVSDSQTVKYATRTDPLVFDKSSDSSWKLSGNWQQELADISEELATLKSGQGQQFDRFAFVTFHQSYGYEDFIEGIRPSLDSDGGTLSYRLEKGIFRQICERALLDPDNQYAIFIDEINRGNISKIFGELITLIEEDKRIDPKSGAGMHVTLPYSKERFGVPSNLRIIGSMNSVDRSLSVVDMALRRRFNFIRIDPISEMVPETVEGIPLRRLFEGLNQRISAILGPDYQLGHSYFMDAKVRSINELKQVWFQQILPLVSEYLYGDWSKIKLLVGPFMEATSLQDSDLEISRFVSESISDQDFKEKLGKLAA